MDIITNALMKIDIAHFVPLAAMFWFFYTRLEAKIDKSFIDLERTIDKLDEKVTDIDRQVNRMEGRSERLIPIHQIEHQAKEG